MADNDNNANSPKCEQQRLRVVGCWPIFCRRSWAPWCELILPFRRRLREFVGLSDEEIPLRYAELHDVVYVQHLVPPLPRPPGWVINLPDYDLIDRINRAYAELVREFFAERRTRRLTGTYLTVDGEEKLINEQYWETLERRAADPRTPVSELVDPGRDRLYPEGRPTKSEPDNPVLRTVRMAVPPTSVTAAVETSSSADRVGGSEGGRRAQPVQIVSEPISQETPTPHHDARLPSPSGNNTPPRRPGRPSRATDIVEVLDRLSVDELALKPQTRLYRLIRTRLTGGEAPQPGLTDQTIRKIISKQSKPSSKL